MSKDIPKFIHIGGLILNTADIEQIRLNAKDRAGKDCIQITLRASTTWNIYKDLEYSRKILVDQLADNRAFDMLIKTKRELLGKHGRRSLVDQMIISEIRQIVE